MNEDARSYTAETACARGLVNTVDVTLCCLKASDVATIAYAAIRGKSQEDEAVQRALDRRRVNAIKKYIVETEGWFYSCVILNWTNPDCDIQYIPSAGALRLPLIERSAQIIDGQHRIAGIVEAIKDRPEIGERHLMVALCARLNVRQAAEMFININTEQRPVPMSLIYDLYGLTSAPPEHEINRARDVVSALNDREDSPYRNLIKYPADKASHGPVTLSAAINSLKPLVRDGGVFEKYGVTLYEHQVSALINYFSALRSKYDERQLWHNKARNPFLSSIGFASAVQYFANDIIRDCIDQRQFKVTLIIELLNLDNGAFELSDKLRALDGKAKRNEIIRYLEACYLNRKSFSDNRPIEY